LARYVEAVCRNCRREGLKLYLKGDRCLTAKCAFDKRAYPPGVHGQRRTKISEYGRQLREKQKAKRIYGMPEKQFRIYYRRSDQMKGITGENLIGMLEKRLDNVIFRLGLAASRNQARQLVLHRHFRVNGQRLNIPSYQVKVGDVVTVNDKSKEIVPIKSAIESGTGKEVPAWLTFDLKDMKGVVERVPVREDVHIPVTEQLIVELYSK